MTQFPFLVGHFATPTQQTHWLGKRLDPRLSGFSPTGSRLIVVRDESPEAWSSSGDIQPGQPAIILPETVRGKEPPGAGVIVGVGPDAGLGDLPFPGGLQLGLNTQPADLLGYRCYFEMWTPIPLRTDIRGKEFIDTVWLMTVRDVQGMDLDTSPRVLKGWVA